MSLKLTVTVIRKDIFSEITTTTASVEKFTEISK